MKPRYEGKVCNSQGHILPILAFPLVARPEYTDCPFEKESQNPYSHGARTGGKSLCVCYCRLGLHPTGIWGSRGEGYLSQRVC